MVALALHAAPAGGVDVPGRQRHPQRVRGRRIGGIARSVLTHPLVIAIALGLVLLLPALGLSELAPELAAAALLTCALPSMSIAAALADQHGEGEFGAAALLLSTVTSFPTLTAWLFVVGALGWLPF